ncbi:MAG: N-acetylmuramoyl-L-alanine amidase [Phycisphaeraceae bacterium]|nr:N-acetylmuramoyl-L-alanine amidase [Phycisphaeraceae bacterium]
MPDRRTLIVLGVLVASMTLAAGLLLALEPQPVLRTADISLNSIDRPRPDEDTLLNTTRPLSQWMAIVIHDSGSSEGSVESIARIHQRLGLGGLAYHFILTNGHGGEDGTVVSGPRWRNQQPGAYSVGPDADWFNNYAIGICLVGDFRRTAPTDQQIAELVKLVHRLQHQFSVPAERVLVRTGSGDEPGQLFPLASFQRQLLTTANP